MRIILIFGSIYLDHPASSIVKTKEKGGMYSRGWRITKAYSGDIMVSVVLNHSTEDDSDNLGKMVGGKRYYGATPI
jgi:hypothetical protein